MAPNKQQSKPRSSVDIIQEIEAINGDHSLCCDTGKIQCRLQALATAITFMESRLNPDNQQDMEWFQDVISVLDGLHADMSLALAEKHKLVQARCSELNDLRDELYEARRAESSDSDD